MTTIEKAAQDIHDDVRILFETSSRLEQIQSHLSPIKDELDAKDAENKALRQIISDSVKALKSGVVSPDASLEFMREVPKEIGLVVDGKDKLLMEARKILFEFSDMCGCNCDQCKAAKDWLARVNPGDRKGNESHE